MRWAGQARRNREVTTGERIHEFYLRMQRRRPREGAALGAQQRQRAEALAKNRQAVDLPPVFEHACIQRPKVDRMRRIARVIESIQRERIAQYGAANPAS